MEEPKSLLANVGEFDVVAVHNPLSTDFTGKVARSIPAASRRTAIDNYAREKYGIELVNQDRTAMEHVQQTITIPSGGTIKMPGTVAQVIVRQLIKEMMQREGARREMSNPQVRQDYEKRVIVNQESMLQDLTTETAEERLQRQLDEMNREDGREDEFPEAKQVRAETDGQSVKADEDSSGHGGAREKLAKIPRASQGSATS